MPELLIFDAIPYEESTIKRTENVDIEGKNLILEIEFEVLNIFRHNQRFWLPHGIEKFQRNW